MDETDYYYHTTNRTVYYSPKYQFDKEAPSGALIKCLYGGTGVGTQTFASFYPSIKSKKVLPDSTKKIVFQQGDTTKSVTNILANFYDNPVHYQVTRSRTMDSKGDNLVTLLKYPKDYIQSGNTVTYNTILDSMIGRNMVSETIEKTESLYYPGSSSGYITGAQLNLYRILSGNQNTILADRTYKLDIQSPLTNFTPFSTSNNITNMDTRNRQMASFDQALAAKKIKSAFGM